MQKATIIERGRRLNAPSSTWKSRAETRRKKKTGVERARDEHKRRQVHKKAGTSWRPRQKTKRSRKYPEDKQEEQTEGGTEIQSENRGVNHGELIQCKDWICPQQAEKTEKNRAEKEEKKQEDGTRMEKAVSGAEKSRQADLTRRRRRKDATTAMDILQLVSSEDEPKRNFSHTMWPRGAQFVQRIPYWKLYRLQSTSGRQKRTGGRTGKDRRHRTYR